MRDSQIFNGKKVRINRSHRGCEGLSGIVTSNTPHRWRGHNYWSVRIPQFLMVIRFLASEMEAR